MNRFWDFYVRIAFGLLYINVLLHGKTQGMGFSEAIFSPGYKVTKKFDPGYKVMRIQG